MRTDFVFSRSGAYYLPENLLYAKKTGRTLMKIYKCQSDGCFSQSDQRNCPICDDKNWAPVDPGSMTTENWDMLLSKAATDEEVFRIVETWAGTGNAEGMRLLSDMYMEGVGCKKDEKKAVELLQQLVEKKNPEALTALGSCYLFGTGIKRDAEKGLLLLWKAKDMKDADAAYLLGLLYENGCVVAQDAKKSRKLFKQAAEYGSDMGMFSHGLALLETAKTEKDVIDAVFWVWRAACENLGEAQLSLGIMLNESDFPIFDEDQAVYWLNRAVENKCGGAASMLTAVSLNRFYRGEKEDFDLDAIVVMLKEAMDRGDCAAAKTLGDLHRDGILGDPDPDLAYKFYRMGQGRSKECSAAVAHCYHYGQGVEKNVGLAFLILSEIIDVNKKNIEKDVPNSAILEFGDMYRDGEGTGRDSCMAASLYGIAASRGDFCARGRLARELLTGNERISVKGDVDPVAILKDACNDGDFDSALFLARHFLSLGDREQAAHFMKEALFLEDYYTGDRATQFAKDNFPELLR